MSTEVTKTTQFCTDRAYKLQMSQDHDQLPALQSQTETPGEASCDSLLSDFIKK